MNTAPVSPDLCRLILAVLDGKANASDLLRDWLLERGGREEHSAIRGVPEFDALLEGVATRKYTSILVSRFGHRMLEEIVFGLVKRAPSTLRDNLQDACEVQLRLATLHDDTVAMFEATKLEGR